MLKREKEKEFIYKTESPENKMKNISKKISKMKKIINELNRNNNLGIVKQQNIFEESNEINIPTINACRKL